MNEGRFHLVKKKALFRNNRKGLFKIVDQVLRLSYASW